MKIISFTMVNNESEIIESFIRYNYNFVDEMVIIDNGCTDSTIKIIRKLIGEGFKKPFLDFQRFLQFSQNRTGKKQHNNNDSFTAYLKCKKTAVYRAKKCCVAVKVSCGASSC